MCFAEAITAGELWRFCVTNLRAPLSLRQNQRSSCTGCICNSMDDWFDERADSIVFKSDIPHRRQHKKKFDTKQPHSRFFAVE